MPRIFKRDPQANWTGFNDDTGQALMHAARLALRNDLSWHSACKMAAEEFGISKRSLEDALQGLADGHVLHKVTDSQRETHAPGMEQLYLDCLNVIQSHPEATSLKAILRILVAEHSGYAENKPESMAVMISQKMLPAKREHLLSLIPEKPNMQEFVKNTLKDYGRIGFAQSLPEAAEIYARLNPEHLQLASIKIYWAAKASAKDWKDSGFEQGICTTNQPLPEDDEDMLTELLRRAKTRMQEQDSEITTKTITLNDLATALTWPEEKLDELQTALDAIEVPEKGQNIEAV